MQRRTSESIGLAERLGRWVRAVTPDSELSTTSRGGRDSDMTTPTFPTAVCLCELRSSASLPGISRIQPCWSSSAKSSSTMSLCLDDPRQTSTQTRSAREEVRQIQCWTMFA